MPDADAVWLGMDSPDNLMIVTAVLRFAEPVDWDRFTATVWERLVGTYPTFGQRAVPSPGPFESPAWSDDVDLDLDQHLVRVDLPVGEQPLQDLVSELLGQPLDMRRPPWQFHLVDQPGSGSAVVARLHHCIADGIALASVLLSLTDPEDGAEPTTPGTEPPATKPHRGLRTRIAESSADVAAVTGVPVGPRARPARRAVATLRLGISVVTHGLGILFAARDPRTRLAGRLGRRKGAAWTRPVPLADVKAVAGALGGTVNDVLLAVTAGALRRHLLEHGERPHDLRIFVPVNLRPADQPVPRSLGNRFGLVFIRLPLSVPDPVARVRAVQERLRPRRARAQAAATFAILSIVGALPPWAHRLAVRLVGAKSTAVVTNVPGPRTPVRLAGARLARIVFWVPQAGSVALGISILSYAGEVTVGVAADRNVVPDPGVLADAFETELTALVDVVPAVGSPR
jgi:diacylglycerol O-acyltransferase / wax synthase